MEYLVFLICRCPILALLLTLVCTDAPSAAQEQLSGQHLSASVETAAMSSNNRQIAALTLASNEKTSGVWEYVESIQVFDSASSKVLAVLMLPSASKISDRSLSSIDFIDYCDDGRYVVAFDKIDTLYVFDTSTYALKSRMDIGDLRSQKGANQILGGRIHCSSHSDVVAVNVYGGSAGWGVLKVFSLATGRELAEVKQDSSLGQEFSDMDLAEDGSSVALLLRNPKHQKEHDFEPNIQIRDTKALKVLSSFSTGDEARGLIFAGSSKLITVPQQSSGKAHDKGSLCIWDLSAKKQLGQLSDANAAVNAPVSSSASGDRVAGDVSVLHECKLCNGLEGRVDVAEQRYGVWDTQSGKEILRSDPFGPKLQPIQPIYKISQDGKTLMIYWHGMDIMPRMVVLP